MPNDAKLGMLVGVVGVIAAAIATAGRTPPPQAAVNVPAAQQTAAPRPAEKPVVKPAAEVKPGPIVEVTETDVRPVPADLPTELPSTPVVRTKREQVATPTSRPRDEDLDP